MVTATYVGSTFVGNGSTSIALPAGTAIGDLIMVGIRAGAGFGNHHAEITDARITSQRTATITFGSAWPELHTTGWGYATSLSDMVVNISALDGNSGGLCAVYRVIGNLTEAYSSGDPTNLTFVPCVPDLVDGAPNLVIVTYATGAGINYTDHATWTQNASGGNGESTYSAPDVPAAESLHLTHGSSADFNMWSALSLGPDPRFWRNLVINPSGEQSFDRAWTASNGMIETAVVWEAG